MVSSAPDSGTELVRYPPEAPLAEQARLLCKGGRYIVETIEGRVQLTADQADVLVGAIRNYERCRDRDLVHLRWRVMSLLGCNTEVFEGFFFWDRFPELCNKRPVDAFEEGRDDEIIELARTIVRRREAAIAAPLPEPLKQLRARRKTSAGAKE